MQHLLVLCAAGDAVGTWVAAGLETRASLPVEIVTSDQLMGCRWEHRLGQGGVTSACHLVDGRSIRSSSIAGVLNRMLFVPDDLLMLIHPTDHTYVHQELHAFLLGWLDSMPVPVLNRPSTQSLCGRVPHISQWLQLAARAGLRTPTYRQSSRFAPAPYEIEASLPGQPASLTKLIVVGGRVLGATPSPTVQAGCSRLSTLVGAPLIGVDFVVNGASDWQFVGATTFPDLRRAGDEGLDALLHCLSDDAAGP